MSQSSRLPPPVIEIDRLAVLDFDLALPLEDGEAIVGTPEIETNDQGIVQTAGSRAPQLSDDGAELKVWLSPSQGDPDPIAAGTRCLVAVRYSTDHVPARTYRRSFFAKVIDE